MGTVPICINRNRPHWSSHVQCQDLTPLILAAGFSSRMKKTAGAGTAGGNGQGIKALLTLTGGVTFLEEIYRKVSFFSEKVIVVLGADKDEIAKRSKLAGAGAGRAQIVYNDKYENGMFSSLKKGLSRVPRGNAFMINPVDCPVVKKETYERLVFEWQKAPGKIHILSFNRRRGHPAIYPAFLVEEILKSPDDLPGGLKFFLEREKELISYVDTEDEGVIMDADTFADYERMEEASQREAGEPPEDVRGKK
ncbi:MAG: nucleotidyltransferase family protein [Elusimicrobiota bacterium]|nr:nucleotidyltransferase family protein [Elusimicrobiota bacterium]